MDPVVEEIPVVVYALPEDVSLHVLTHAGSVGLDEGARLRAKPAWSLLQADVPLPASGRSGLRESELGVDALRLAGGPTPTADDNSVYYIGRRVVGPGGDAHVALVPMPVSGFATMRPTLTHIDEADARSRARRDASAPGGGPTSPPMSPPGGGVQFRRRETEQQLAARLSSHGHLQRQVDDAPWVELALSGAKTEETAFFAESLFHGLAVKPERIV